MRTEMSGIGEIIVDRRLNGVVFTDHACHTNEDDVQGHIVQQVVVACWKVGQLQLPKWKLSTPLKGVGIRAKFKVSKV
eukprot:1148523-Pelagomonas_calceolata.AAC.1